MILSSSSPKETGKIAASLAEEIVNTQKNRQTAFVIGLFGNLGAGKTTFIRGFARGLGIRKNVTSPTFLILKRYPLRRSRYKNIYHIDAYRIGNTKELKSLDFKKIIGEPENIVVVEWAEKIEKILPKKMLRVNFRYGKKENERTLKFQMKK